MSTSALDRRRFMQRSGAVALATAATTDAAAQPPAGPHQALGTRVGEASDTSAIVWARLTKHPLRNNSGVTFSNEKGSAKKEKSPPDLSVEQIEGACPGMAGRVRLRYSLHEDLSDARETAWVEVGERTDFIHQFTLRELRPDSTYHYISQAATLDDERVSSEFRGAFHTAPPASEPSSLRFCVMTCQGYQDRDHVDGHPIYPAMLALQPRFVSLTGDLVYYDSNAPRAVNPALARLHWERMFSLPRLVALLRSTSTYWLKDDHDVLTNDTWPGMKVGELTFAAGQEIFRQQAPLGAGSAYRTFRWGRDLQVWFAEGRDFRSQNSLLDGPEKTIWGAEQKAWFKQTVQQSDATWKLLISPTPLVGPDRPKGKNDNHSNEGFAHEGNELRAWIQSHVSDQFFVINGDRHWQYYSVHPETGVREFSVGPASDSHASGSPGYDAKFHRFHRVQGGFLCVELRPQGQQSEIVFQLRDVNGGIAYEQSFRRSIR